MAGQTQQPWYRKSKRAWYVWHDGRQIRLHADKTEAFKLWHGIQTRQAETPQILDSGPLTIRDACSAFLAARAPLVEPSTLAAHRRYCGRLSDALGEKAAEALTAADLLSWAQRRWKSPSTQWLALTIAQAVLRQAGITPPRMNKPSCRSRGADAVMSEQDFARLSAAVKPALRDVLLAIRHTGCRPNEVRRVEVRHFFPTASAWLLDFHKAFKKTGKPRPIVLTPLLSALCVRLCAERGEGILFRNAKGVPWTKDSLHGSIVHYCKRLGITTRLYGLRHGLATELLTAGVPDTHVAAILGHSNTAMLHKHYSHLTSQTQTLREALERVRGESSDSPPPPPQPQ